jgi:hypothetical protein
MSHAAGGIRPPVRGRGISWTGMATLLGALYKASLSPRLAIMNKIMREQK